MQRDVRALTTAVCLALEMTCAFVREANAQPSFDLPCTISFHMQVLAGFTSVAFNVGYDPAEVRFVGSGTGVACQPLARDNDGGLAAGLFDDDNLGTVGITIVSETGFPGLTPLAICDFRAAVVPLAAAFALTTTSATGPNGEPVTELPEVEVLDDDIDCGPPSSTTTTSTTSTTSTTTMTTTTTLGEPGCADPVAPFGAPSATDCLFILRAAVGLEPCVPDCLCAPKGTVPPAATDSLRCLRYATGQDVTLNCPCP